LETYTFKVGEDYKNQRLDKFLHNFLSEFSRSYIASLIEEGFVKVDGIEIKKPSKKLKRGQIVEVAIPEPQKVELKPEPIPLKVIYEDKDLAVVYKPPGLVVHPSPSYESGTLVNALLYHFKELSTVGGSDRPGIVHRLDKGTAGLMVVAKNDESHRKLSQQFHDRITDKRYLALITPPPKEAHGIIDLPIGRSVSDRKKFSVFSPKAREAKTEYWIKENFPKGLSSLLDIKIYTGRTHQIRVHLKSLGSVIWGDTTYGFKVSRLPKEVRSLVDFLPKDSFWLVSYHLGFYHPRTEKWMEFNAEPPEEYLKILDGLRVLEKN